MKKLERLLGEAGFNFQFKGHSDAYNTMVDTVGKLKGKGLSNQEIQELLTMIAREVGTNASLTKVA